LFTGGKAGIIQLVAVPARRLGSVERLISPIPERVYRIPGPKAAQTKTKGHVRVGFPSHSRIDFAEALNTGERLINITAHH